MLAMQATYDMPDTVPTKPMEAVTTKWDTPSYTRAWLPLGCTGPTACVVLTFAHPYRWAREHLLSDGRPSPMRLRLALPSSWT